MNSRSITITLSGLALGAVYVFATPYITLVALRLAIQNNNVQKIERFIDFADLRDSLRSQLAEHTQKQAAEGESDAPELSQISAGIGQVLGSTLIDMHIQPRNIPKWLEGSSIFGGEEKSEGGSLIERLGGTLANISTGYTSFETFDVKFGDGQPISGLVLERRNLVFWKIVSIKMSREEIAKGTGNTHSGGGINQASNSCDNTKKAIEQEIRSSGSSVDIQVLDGEPRVFDLDLQGPRDVRFSLGKANLERGERDNSGNPASQIMGSDQKLKSYAKRIATNCKSTGKISFGLYGSDWIENFAYTSQGSLLAERCSHDPNDPVFSRRATYINHPEGRSMNGSCTYINL